MQTLLALGRWRGAARLAAFVCGAAAAVVAGCTSSAPTVAPVDESGVYVLRAVDGAPLPFRQLLDRGVDTLEIVADTLTATAPLTVTEIRWSAQRGPIVPSSWSAPSAGGRAGVYRREEARIELYFNKTAPIVGTVSRRLDSLSLRNVAGDSTHVWLFTR